MVPVCSQLLHRYTEEEVWDAVSVVATAIEVVGSRWSGAAFENSNALQKLSDCGLNVCCITGAGFKKEEVPRDLDKIQVSIAVNGEVQAEGSGANVLGHPLTSLTWLVRRFAFNVGNA
jgi:2-keto-4-pentenoate hydratase